LEKAQEQAKEKLPMAKHEHKHKNSDLERLEQPSAPPAGSVDLPAEPEKIRKIVAEKEHNTEGGTTVERHLDVAEEKKASKARGNPNKGGQGRITNPKTNTSNQYR
jgi:hypothetical protein